jgi:hypothetical protein
MQIYRVNTEHGRISPCTYLIISTSSEVVQKIKLLIPVVEAQVKNEQL